MEACEVFGKLRGIDFKLIKFHSERKIDSVNNMTGSCRVLKNPLFRYPLVV